MNQPSLIKKLLQLNGSQKLKLLTGVSLTTTASCAVLSQLSTLSQSNFSSAMRITALSCVGISALGFLSYPAIVAIERRRPLTIEQKHARYSSCMDSIDQLRALYRKIAQCLEYELQYAQPNGYKSRRVDREKTVRAEKVFQSRMKALAPLFYEMGLSVYFHFEKIQPRRSLSAKLKDTYHGVTPWECRSIRFEVRCTDIGKFVECTHGISPIRRRSDLLLAQQLETHLDRIKLVSTESCPEAFVIALGEQRKRLLNESRLVMPLGPHSDN